jgi:outer membrane protein OmpA-like peptidoglycan-associated protein
MPVVVDPDPDRDGIKGAADKCPTIPEVYDNVRDEDGCPDDMGSDPSKDPGPDLTNDPTQDPTQNPGTAPEAQETTPTPCPASGPRPEGCADMGRARWTGQAIVLEPPIRFETDTATIRVESGDTVRALAALLGTELAGKRARIEGHFKAALDATSKLPELRANAVLEALVAAGVRADRLEAIGLRYDLDAGGRVPAGIVVKVLATK